MLNKYCTSQKRIHDGVEVVGAADGDDGDAGDDVDETMTIQTTPRTTMTACSSNLTLPFLFSRTESHAAGINLFIVGLDPSRFHL